MAHGLGSAHRRTTVLVDPRLELGFGFVQDRQVNVVVHWFLNETASTASTARNVGMTDGLVRMVE